MMKTAEQMAQYIRHRQHELAALEPARRRNMLAAEIGQLCSEVSATEKKALLGEVEELFPTGFGGAAAAVIAAPPTPAQLEFDDVMHGLQREIEAQPEADRAALREEIANRLGLRPALPASSFRLDQLLAAFEALK